MAMILFFSGRKIMTAAVLLAGICGTARSEETLRIASDDWCPFVCAHHDQLTDGFLVDITQKAMSLTGYRVVPTLMPLNRAMQETMNSRIEGVYAPPNDNRLLFSVPMIYSHACFYTRANETWNYHDLGSLQHQAIGIIDDYGYDNGPVDHYIAQHRDDRQHVVISYGGTAGTNNIQKLLASRFPALLEHEAVVDYLGHKMGVEKQLRKAGCLTQSLPLMIGFSKSPEGARQAEALRRGLTQLIKSGEFSTLLKRYRIPAQ